MQVLIGLRAAHAQLEAGLERKGPFVQYGACDSPPLRRLSKIIVRLISLLAAAHSAVPATAYDPLGVLAGLSKYQVLIYTIILRDPRTLGSRNNEQLVSKAASTISLKAAIAYKQQRVRCTVVLRCTVVRLVYPDGLLKLNYSVDLLHTNAGMCWKFRGRYAFNCHTSSCDHTSSYDQHVPPPCDGLHASLYDSLESTVTWHRLSHTSPSRVQADQSAAARFLDSTPHFDHTISTRIPFVAPWFPGLQWGALERPQPEEVCSGTNPPVMEARTPQLDLQTRQSALPREGIIGDDIHGASGFTKFKRSTEFWARTVSIYASFKVCTRGFLLTVTQTTLLWRKSHHLHFVRFDHA